MHRHILISKLLVLLLAVTAAFPCVYAQDNFRFHVLTIDQLPQVKAGFEEVKDNNLPIVSAACVYETSDQVIWIGTEQFGLYAYYGTGFKHYRYELNDLQGLPSNNISGLWEEASGILWITTSKGLVKFNRTTGKFTRFAQDSKNIIRDDAGKLYTTANDLHLIDTATKKLTRVEGQEVFTEDGKRYGDEYLRVVDKLCYAEGKIWAIGKSRTLSGLFHFDAASHHWIFHPPPLHYAAPGQLSPDPGYLFTENLYADKNGCIWVNGWDIGLLCYNSHNGVWDQFYMSSNKKDLWQNVMRKVTQLNDSCLLVTGPKYVLVFNTYTHETRTYADLPNMMYAITFKDHNDNIWFASDGVYKTNKYNNRFSPITQLPVAPAVITACLQLPNGASLIACTDNTNKLAIVTTLSLVKEHNIIKTFQLPVHDFIHELIPAGKNNFYLAAKGLYTFDLATGSTRAVQLKATGMPQPATPPVDFYSNVLWNDSILYSCRRTTEEAGLRKINLRTREVVYFKTSSKTLSPQAPQGNSINRIMKDSYGRIWCSSEGGIDLFYPETETFEHYHYIEGDTTSLPDNSFPRFIETSGHRFYVATQSGLCEAFATPGKKVTFRRIIAQSCTGITEDQLHKLWLSGNYGMMQYDPQTNITRVFTLADGYKWSTLFRPYVMQDGSFMMRDGSVFNPYNLPQNRLKPVTRLNDFFIAGQPAQFDTAIGFGKNIRLRYDQNFFSIAFSCNSFIHEQDNKYRYFLKGVDKNWVDAGTRNVAYYTSVSPGNYSFFVQAANNDGVWGDPKQLLTISVVPAWYQTILFRFLLVATVVAIMYVIYRQRMNIVKAKSIAREKEAELKLVKTEFEKQMAETEMAALRAQMNPHFIFNVLNSINRFILLNDSEAASEYLSQFSKLIRLILEHSKTPRVSLEKDLEALRIYIEMEKLRFQNKFTYSVEVDEEVEEGYVQVPPLLLQPFAENAIWHGLMQKNEPGHLHIRIEQVSEELIKVMIEDDGIGRQRSAELKSKSALTHKSFGLQISKDRIRIVNKLYGVKTEVEVEDLYDAAKEPAGTRINLFIAV